MAAWPEEKQAGYPLNGKYLRKIRLFINFPFDFFRRWYLVLQQEALSRSDVYYFIKKDAMDLRTSSSWENLEFVKASLSFFIRMFHKNALQGWIELVR